MDSLKTLALAAAMTHCVAAAQPFNHWYEPPSALETGLCVIEHLACPVDRAVIHARAALTTKGGTWGLVWDYTDAANKTSALLTFPPLSVHDDVIKPPVLLTVERIEQGQTVYHNSCSLTDGIDYDGRFNSIKLVYEDGMAILSVGADTEAVTLHVPFASLGAVATYADTPGKCRRLQCETETQTGRPVSRFTDIDALKAYLKTSTDPIEGYWTYLDRNTRQPKAELGGEYTLAIVGNGEGYDIVYLYGADIGADEWMVMDLKGRLRPTAFQGNYDLQWLSADHQMLDSENNAQLSSDGAILTCRFPLLGSQLRFTRATSLQKIE